MSKVRNRGKDSSDDKWFAPKWHLPFKEAADDLGFLLTRGYANNSALQIVGNRYKLNKRQRNALLRVACSNQDILRRNEREILFSVLEGKTIEIDGFNLLILLESILSEAYVFKCRDQVYRDISSVHGSYKRVMKTEEAMLVVGEALKKMKVSSIKWYLDQPVSNSGRLKTQLLEVSQQHDFNWEVELVFDPDKELAKNNNIVISSDGWILDQVDNWFNLVAYLIKHQLDDSNVLEF